MFGLKLSLLDSIINEDKYFNLSDSSLKMFSMAAIKSIFKSPYI